MPGTPPSPTCASAAGEDACSLIAFAPSQRAAAYPTSIHQKIIQPRHNQLFVVEPLCGRRALARMPRAEHVLGSDHLVARESDETR